MADQVLLLDELTTFLDGADQRGVLEAVRRCVGGPDQARGASSTFAPIPPAYNCWHVHNAFGNVPWQRTFCLKTSCSVWSLTPTEQEVPVSATQLAHRHNLFKYEAWTFQTDARMNDSQALYDESTCTPVNMCR